MAVMDLVVEKAYPIGWFEFVEIDGRKVREGPRNEKDEIVEQDAWRVSDAIHHCRASPEDETFRNVERMLQASCATT